ncbi:hypothetical protein [Streptomyces sp. ME18-1-4]|uniref:hypothetical protein n=1 Tax=Streptomyces sp. ME18-1-4 TaxID=3028685 RepID=UPI0029BDA0E0|nr:hypothetical protein [Streptomyces sp. ME18-1-4]MDX3247461.1 hypothetical protein [Streptomyces sp. ME18-1-4]
MQAETVMAVAATVVALGSLWVGYSQGKAARVHNRQSLRPGFQVVDAGLGPAVVTDSVVRWDGVVVGRTTFLVRFDSDDPERLRRFYDRIKTRLVITVHYESVYGGEDFVVSSDLPE